MVLTLVEREQVVQEPVRQEPFALLSWAALPFLFVLRDRICICSLGKNTLQISNESPRSIGGLVLGPAELFDGSSIAALQQSYVQISQREYPQCLMFIYTTLGLFTRLLRSQPEWRFAGEARTKIISCEAE